MIRALLLLVLAAFAAPAHAADDGLHPDPYLVLDPGRHTAPIIRLDADREGRFLVTASHDKTVRVWAASDGSLLRTLRLPAGPGDVGKAYAVAISPDGTIVAAGGRTSTTGTDESIYLFDRASGRLLRRVGGLPMRVLHLAFSTDGGRLASSLGPRGPAGGVALIDPASGRVVAEDTGYGDQSYGAAFDAVGRLATTSWDGKLRLYDPAGHLLRTEPAPGGSRPFGLAFSPDGRRLAVGYDDSTRVDVLGGASLKPLLTPDGTGVDNGSFYGIAWSADGSSLFAAGRWNVDGQRRLRRWPEGGQGAPVDLALSQNTVMSLRPLLEGWLAFAAGDPRLGVLGGDGRERWSLGPAGADFRGPDDVLAVSADGVLVRFGYEPFGRSPALLRLAERRLVPEGSAAGLAMARVEAPGLAVAGWENGTEPTLNGKRLALDAYETAFSLAIAPDGQRFVLGTNWSLRLFDRAGKEVWRRAVPGIAWAVAVSGDGRLLVAAYADGTIRWHRLGDGVELLAFYPDGDRERWVLWTPRGYYDASPGAEEMIGWQVNRGRDQAPEFYPAAKFRDQFHRPDVIDLVLRELDVDDAVTKANAVAGRRQPAPAPKAIVAAIPVAAILEPSDGARIEEDVLRLRYIVDARAGSRIRQVRVLIDGQEVLALPGFEVPEGGVERRAAVQVEGNAERLTLIVEGEEASSEPVSIRLERTAVKESRKPSLWILAAGISEYGSQPNLRLRYAAKDAAEFVAAMKRQANGALYGRVEVQLLQDEAASWDAIEGGLRWLEERVEQGDVAMVFFSGHGMNDRYGDLMLLPADADISTPARRQRAGFPYAGLQQTLIQLARKSKTVAFLDACYSGNLRDALAPDTSRVVADLAAEDNGVIVFASAGPKQLSEEYEAGENGAFTEALLEGLSGKADYDKSRVLHFSELHRFVRARVEEITDKRQQPVADAPEGRVGDPPLLVIR